jgi:hypothetical protein
MSRNFELIDPVTGKWKEGIYETQAMRGLEQLRELIAFLFCLFLGVCFIAVGTVVLSEIVGMKEDKTVLRGLLVCGLIALGYHVICASCV